MSTNETPCAPTPQDEQRLERIEAERAHFKSVRAFAQALCGNPPAKKDPIEVAYCCPVCLRQANLTDTPHGPMVICEAKCWQSTPEIAPTMDDCIPRLLQSITLRTLLNAIHVRMRTARQRQAELRAALATENTPATDPRRQELADVIKAEQFAVGGETFLRELALELRHLVPKAP